MFPVASLNKTNFTLLLLINIKDLEVVHVVAVAGFVLRYLSGPLPYE